MGAVLRFPQPDQDNMVKLIQAFARRVCIYTFTRGADQLLPNMHIQSHPFPGDPHNRRFRCHRSMFRCVSSGSHMFVFSSRT